MILIILILVILFLLITYLTYHFTFFSFPINRKDIMSLPPGKQFEENKEKMGKIIRELENVAFEKVSIRSFDNLKLVARYYHAEDKAPVHIQFHGYRGSGVRDFCGGNKIARELGHNVLLVTQRASGESGGRSITFGIKEFRDCLSWINYAISRFGDDCKIILSGISMGAATVLKATGEPLPDNVVGVIADSPFSSAEKIIRFVCDRMGMPSRIVYPFIVIGAKLFAGVDLKDGDVLPSVRRNTKPILIIHGEDDRFVPCDMSREIVRNCEGDVKLVTFAGAGHGLSYITDEERYKNVIADFVNDCLNG